ncbi:alkene reductase [Nocardia sp. NPDC005745]|uniref:alkene reductase n=1 Tax=Nocardia sp. NPDC005745 TaxID=3157061 RepID=UPI0033D3A711
MSIAFEPFDLSGQMLANRIVMAPMTRSRASADGFPAPTAATYYAQRASAGLIITEAVYPSIVGKGYPYTPGLHSVEQVDAWRNVTDAVHAAGGVIFPQLWHTGRAGHPSVLPEGLMPEGPSPVAAAAQGFTVQGWQDLVAPVEMTEERILATVQDFAAAARNAIDAGFDGVEVHGGNGFLLHQFLSTNANLRTDGWGGSVAGRIRFTLEVVEAVSAAIGANRVGLRISPANPLFDIVEEGYRDTYLALADALAPMGLAYLHVAESCDRDLTVQIRRRFGGTFILNPNTPAAMAIAGPSRLKLIDDGIADLVSFGALFLANPDLPARLAAGGPFNLPDSATFYGGDEHGYIDYPSLDEVNATT